MGRKKTNPGIYLYPHDILSSPRCRSLTPGGAGIYFFLFLRLCDPPIPGAYRLRDWEPHPKWAKSDTRKCLSIADKRERLTLFAKWLAKNDLPWTKNEVLPYLQELYDRGIIIVEGDMLIQPRLYVDNGFEIPDIDGDGDPVGSILDDPVSGQMRAYDNTLQGGLNLRKNKGTEKGTEKSTGKGTKKGTKKPRVGAGDAGAPLNRVGVGDINNNSSIGNIGGVGDAADDPTGFWEFWQAYDKKRTADGQHWIAIENVRAAWESLTDDERAAAMDFLPAYVRATPAKRWRMHPTNFLLEKAWLTIEIAGGRVVSPKTEENNPDGGDGVQKDRFERGKHADSATVPPVAQKRADGPEKGSDGQKIPVADQPPTLREIQEYMQSRGDNGDPFRHITAEEFYDDGCQNGWTIRGGQPLYDWRARLRSLEGYRHKNGEPVSTLEGYVAYEDGKLKGTLAVGKGARQPKPGDPVSATPAAKGKYKNKW